MLFSIGDYLAGMTVGVVTALAVRMVVWPGMDMVIAMIVGMTLGMLIHIVLGLVMATLIGMFNAMMPASLIGMYGGFSGCATPWRLALARGTPQLWLGQSSARSSVQGLNIMTEHFAEP